MLKSSKYILLFLSVFLLGCSHPQKKWEQYSQIKPLMATTARLDICSDRTLSDQEMDNIFKPVWDRLEEIAWRMNVFDEKSDIALINRAYPNAATVGADTVWVIKEALMYHTLTKGTFDITVWPLIQLWKEGKKNNRVPDPQQIKEVQQSMGSKMISILSDKEIKLNHSSTKIDLGGIAAGYAVDEAARLFRLKGIAHFYIDIGGDMYVSGHNCKGDKWHIGIRDPKSPSDMAGIVALSDMGITTSGDYNKYIEIQGERWSHIYNPITGYPQKGVVSATVIAPTTIAADALATAMTVLGPQEGIKMMDGLGEGFAVLVIEPDENMHLKKFYSKRFQEYQLP